MGCIGEKKHQCPGETTHDAVFVFGASPCKGLSVAWLRRVVLRSGADTAGQSGAPGAAP